LVRHLGVALCNANEQFLAILQKLHAVHVARLGPSRDAHM
jgi:hypothetical protein